MCHAPEAGIRAESFSIKLDLRLEGAGSEQAKAASYGFEIGRDPAHGAGPVVLREECQVELADGTAEGFVLAAGRLAVAPMKYGGEAGKWAAHGRRERRDRLFLPLLGLDSPLREVESALLGMRFYELDSTILRNIDDDTERHTSLGPRGEHLGHVLGALSEAFPETKDYLDGWIRAIIPQALGVDERREGEFSTVRARFWTGEPHLPFRSAVNRGATREGDPHVSIFQRQELSEGTVRAAGVLAALFQPGTFDGSIPLVAIEEPEMAIHPSNAAALFEAIEAASARTQVIVTTQSSDLLDDEYVKPEHLRMVEMVRGVTRIGELDEHTRRHLTERPDQIAVMHRQGHLRPADPDTGRP
ncbi:ATP-binding protein [Nonomuraea sp. K274]|uniref:ATP-binding protein n=1 Tax=Nonomuraea cypriaca TaxID=1187855 RepID=A0A931AJJ6_9ACTN|nr:AAA family ATPase [Nonomuraea cypriaca]MBF8191564.1 ATP-binding protein [Nonomuraea cypriaca]